MPFGSGDAARPRLDTVLTHQVLCPVLLGRDHELSALRAAVQGATDGRGGLALILGEAGVGKSRLAREVEALAAQEGCVILSGRAAEGQSRQPFRPLAEAMFSALRETGPPEDPELVPFHAALGHLVPQWRTEAVERDDAFLALLGEAVLRLLGIVAASGRGCLLVLEDLHWADAETIAVLEYLADNLVAEPVLCLGTLRAEEHSPAFALASSLTARRAGLVLELDRLDAAATRKMGEACLSSPSVPEEVLEALWGWTEGIPFLVEEMLAAWLGSGVLRAEPGGWSLRASVGPVVPVSFAETVRRRVAEAGPEALGVLAAAAALGRSFDWTLVTATTDLDDETVLGVLRRCVAAQLLSCELSPGTVAFEFRHALTRNAILNQVFPPERVALFRRALWSVEHFHPGLPGPWCETAADLAEMSGSLEHAARLLLLSGRRALGQGALTTAEATLERGRAFAGEDSALAADLDEVLAEVLAFAAKTDQAVEVGARLLDNVELSRAVDTPRRAAAHLRLARALVPSGDWPSVDAHLTQARRLARQAGTVVLLPAIDAVAAHVALGEARLDDATTLARAALDSAEQAGLPEVACEALEVIGRRARLRDLLEAEIAFERAKRLAETHGLTVWRIRAVHD